jgi:hypothetical protein
LGLVRVALGLGLAVGLGVLLGVGLFIAAGLQEPRSGGQPPSAGVSAEQASAAPVQASRQAERCGHPEKVVASAQVRSDKIPRTSAYHAHLEGTARNTCDHPVRVSLEVAALTADGRIAATAWPVQRTLAVGEQVSFTSYLGILDASQRIASLRVTPTVFVPE